MRSREEINEQIKNQIWHAQHIQEPFPILIQKLTVEILLDIRELLLKQQEIDAVVDQLDHMVDHYESHTAKGGS